MISCMSCKHRKDEFVPCDWLAEQKTVIMPPCPRYEKEETVKEYIERAAIEKFIEDGLNNPDKNKAFGHDAIEIMAEVHYMQAADVVEFRQSDAKDESLEDEHEIP